MNNIRNFVIIAHIDHGKSTLADRFLEITGTVEKRKMRPQYLDQLELEREKGITIKMAPVRMSYILDSKPYILNLIDTPGHSDFAYEVSRALFAVEGAILLVDVTQGIQAQTLSNFRTAQKAGLKIIGALNKIDLKSDVEKEAADLAKLVGVRKEEIHKISAKTGEGVKNLLEKAILKFPPPKSSMGKSTGRQMLIFDSLYNEHKGILAFGRVFAGEFKNQETAYLLSNKKKFKIKEVGYFAPELQQAEKLSEGEIGYFATGFKEPNSIKIGDTIGGENSTPLSGFKEPKPVIFVSFYPADRTSFEDLEEGFKKLHLNDAALSSESDYNEVLGKGLKIGFLGELHFEITSARLEKEFNLEFLTTFPTIVYRGMDSRGESSFIKQPQDFSEKFIKVFEPLIKVEILTPAVYLNPILTLAKNFYLEIKETKNFSETSLILVGQMPLAELVRNFSDDLKSVSRGYASFNYEIFGEKEVEIEKLEILINGEAVPGLTRLVLKKEIEKEGRLLAERLKNLLPRKQFSQAVQAKTRGKIIAREDIPALKKLLGNFGKTGGDRTRKMKLWQKQKRGKEKLKMLGRVRLSPDIFRELLKK